MTVCIEGAAMWNCVPGFSPREPSGAHRRHAPVEVTQRRISCTEWDTARRPNFLNVSLEKSTYGVSLEYGV